jgi:hypothetical protein
LSIYISIFPEPFSPYNVVVIMRNGRIALSIRKSAVLSVMSLLFGHNLYAQRDGNNAWLFISHTQKVSEKFDVLADVQLRSADHFTAFSSILLRTALNYNISKDQSVALGYAHKGDWETENGEKTYFPEHRVYEQYLHNFDIQRMELTVRGRLEQRFVCEERYQFSQRARLMLSAQIPLVSDKDFSKGIYASLQNEIFLNIHHKDRVNGSVFDQNRPYVAAGYRFNKHLDMEFGYTRWLQRETEGDQTTHVMQLMITSNL